MRLTVFLKRVKTENRPLSWWESGELSMQLHEDFISDRTFKNMRHLTEDEKAVLNYIFYTQGRDAALQWHNSRMSIYQDRANGVLTAEMFDWGKESPFLSSVASVAMSLGSGFEQIGDWISGDYNNSLARATSAIRSGVSEKTDLMIGNWDAFDFLYNTGMSGVDSLAASVLPGGAGSVLLGLSAAAQATNDALDTGQGTVPRLWSSGQRTVPCPVSPVPLVSSVLVVSNRPLSDYC